MELHLSHERFVSLSEIPLDAQDSDNIKETIDPITKEEIVKIIENDKQLSEQFKGKKVFVTTYPITHVNSIKILYL